MSHHYPHFQYSGQASLAFLAIFQISIFSCIAYLALDISTAAIFTHSWSHSPIGTLPMKLIICGEAIFLIQLANIVPH